ncbi:hypothetical protein [Fluviicola taffensis]|uniref:Uncharacterized protein n=1 Tax=Fluviicola taffensis (strain DSM 16823 / NCIMB 13979 / RW262) TaxID=755732 RepID=F2I9H2_FLUTR|nr:hypothetical protein [Fluviicola taffensis]AEA45153.1 hypothetical protein Fluta_3179 [Fluviicola taffensis DSM 16823]
MKFNLYFTQIGFCFLVVSVSTVAQTSNSKNVLFLGNSYTSANNLPQMIADAAASVGDTLNYESETPGGAFLANLINFPSYYNGVSKIMNGGWDHVVMQDQSLAYSNYVPLHVNAAHQLDSCPTFHVFCKKGI